MRSRVRVIELASERLVFQQADNFPDDPAPEIREALFKLTGRRWQVEHGTGTAQPSLREAAAAEAEAEDARVRSDPLVKAALAAFPQAELLGTEGNVARAANLPWN
jgi:DNA polymerase-3 subunit gamma/tau